jgi:hypothetical protein
MGHDRHPMKVSRQLRRSVARKGGAAFAPASPQPRSGWSARLEDLDEVAARQLFFVGGAPRSGTTWLQQILDSHPQVSCRGEGLFGKTLAEPLDAMAAARRQALEGKNAGIFRHSGGYPLPADEDTDVLLGTAILLALRQQGVDQTCRAIGEKTPENVFFFPRIKRLFPAAKFIGIARDPRDLLTSAWHFFHRRTAGEDEVAAKTAFIRSAMPSLSQGARAMIALTQGMPMDCLMVTYEALQRAPVPQAARLFHFLGVADDEATVTACIARTSFAAMTGGRAAGVEQSGSFFRKGVVGDWRTTLTPAMNEMVLAELGWMFPHFGWQA